MSHDANGFYGVMKGRAYALAQVAAGCSNSDAAARGFKDVFGLVMSDSDHDRQAMFLSLLPATFPSEEHRRILLDGLASEYGHADGWMAYVNQHTSGA